MLKTFNRGVIGGVGWSFGVCIGSIVLCLIFIYFFNYFHWGKYIQSYFEELLKQTTAQQVQTQKELLNTIIPGAKTGTLNIPTDFYPENIDELLNNARIKN